MKHYKKRLIITVALLAILNACSNTKIETDTTTSQVTGNPESSTVLPQSTLQRVHLNDKKIKFSDQISFDVNQYIEQSDFRNANDTKIVFNADFQEKFLTQKPLYKESYAETTDRLIVTRELTVHTKNPCDPALTAAFTSLCFTPKEGTLTSGMKKGLLVVRRKIEARIQQGHPDTDSWRAALNMDDVELLNYLLNQRSKIKTISRTSVIPYNAYPLKGFQHQPVTDLSKPLRLNNTLAQQLPTERLAAETIIAGENNNGVVAANQELHFPIETELTRNIVMGQTLAETFGDTYKLRFAKSTYFTDEYYVRFVYDVSFGLGIRFPFELKTKGKVTHVVDRRNNTVSYPTTSLCRQVSSRAKAEGCATRATFSVTGSAVNTNKSTTEFYRQAGVPSDEVFNGDEFVFKIGASCRLSASVPGPNLGFSCPSAWNSIVDERHNYTPPLGNARSPLARFTKSGRELGLAYDTGLGYVALNPTLVVSGNEGKLDISLTPSQSRAHNNANSRLSADKLTLGRRSENITVNESVTKGETEYWGVSTSVDKYSLGITLQPGVEVEAGVDLGIYEWVQTLGPYTIDALAIDIGNYSFDIHEGVKSQQELLLGVRDNSITIDDPFLYRITDAGNNPDNMILAQNQNCTDIRKIRPDKIDQDLIDIGDVIRFGHFQVGNASVLNPNSVEHIGPTENIKGFVKTNNNCNYGKIQVSTSCDRICDVYLETNTCHALGLVEGDYLQISGQFDWRSNTPDWQSSRDTYCVVQQAEVAIIP